MIGTLHATQFIIVRKRVTMLSYINSKNPRVQLCCFLPGCVSMKSKEMGSFGDLSEIKMNGIILIQNGY